MIVKFEVDEAWQIFDDVDSLMYRKLRGDFKYIELEDSQAIIDYTKTIVNGLEMKEGTPNRILLTFMNSKQLDNTQVVAYSPIYLMNNNGRTIETI